jgi:23S rRNA pseudouridine1911/1915/1917 synthase
VDLEARRPVSSEFRFTVPEELDGCRLDRCLVELTDRWTRSRVRRLIDQDRVHLNEGPAKPATLVRAGDRLTVNEPLPRPLELEPEAIPLDVVFEDRHLIVLNKPSDLVVHPAAGRSSGTLVNALLQHCHDLSGIGGFERPGIVHRLDRDTSGIMVVAKSEKAHLALAMAFRRRQVEKTYLALCYGVPQQAEEIVEAPIGRHPRERKQMAVVPTGRSARTRYSVQERFEGSALLHCRPVTGRTHQIRVHMAHVGHALIGDPLYAGRQWRNLGDPRLRSACRDFPRQALHAWRLSFIHPATKKPVEYEAPIPRDMSELIDTLRG